jgi:IS5 family transposase
VKQKTTKAKYRLRNWKEYNASLKQRGSLTFWISPDVVEGWINTKRNGKRGRDLTFTDAAIQTMSMIKEFFHLGLRQTEGFVESVFALLGSGKLKVPDYSTLCRRRKVLEVALPRVRAGESIHVLVDSTGMKVFGEGEWKVRRHGYTKRRTWRKLHIGVDAEQGEIVAAVVTTNDCTDGQVLPDLLEQVPETVTDVTGDGAYDKRNCYDAIRQRGARAKIPPRRGAKIWRHANTKAERLARDENLRRIRKVGRAQWKRESGYHQRSRVEATMFQLKTIFGDKVSARTFEGQAAQMLLRCAALNKLNQLPKAQSYKV